MRHSEDPFADITIYDRGRQEKTDSISTPFSTKVRLAIRMSTPYGEHPATVNRQRGIPSFSQVRHTHLILQIHDEPHYGILAHLRCSRIWQVVPDHVQIHPADFRILHVSKNVAEMGISNHMM
ncbi:hypothetical protein DPSP01_010717 [Paraphaeosphaeria sporulosa]